MHAISDETQGIIFIGTPHTNDGKRSVGKIAAMAVRAGFPNLDDEVEEIIKQDPAFELFNNTFQEYLEKREHSVHVVSFYEEQQNLCRAVRYLDSPTILVLCIPLSPDCDESLRFASHATTLCKVTGQPHNLGTVSDTK